MKPAVFTYHAPPSLDECLGLLAEHGADAKILAGGQSLVPAMNFRLARPAMLIDVNRVPGLDEVRVDDEMIQIGSLVRHATLERPIDGGPLGTLLPYVARHIAHAPIRARGTFGGSLSHADPSSEWCLVAQALGAEIVVARKGASRIVKAQDFFKTIFTTALEPDELLTTIRLPRLGASWRCGFAEYSRRAGDFGLALAVVALRIDGGVIGDARIGLGGVGATPLLSPAAAAVLIGATPGDEIFRATAVAAAGDCDPPDDIHATADYRRDLVGALVRRALLQTLSPLQARDVVVAPQRTRGPVSVSPTAANDKRLSARASEGVSLTVNGKTFGVRVEPRHTLADTLREGCGLTGTHLGCEHGVCGACTVLVDDMPVRSCLMFAVQAQGAAIRTVEGLAHGEALGPLQSAFWEKHGLQCGFCTPGFLMLATWLLERDGKLDRADLEHALSSNLCRCTGYQNILEAVTAAAKELGKWTESAAA